MSVLYICIMADLTFSERLTRLERMVMVEDAMIIRDIRVQLGKNAVTLDAICNNMDLILSHIDDHIVPTVNETFSNIEDQVHQLQTSVNLPSSQNEGHNPHNPLHTIEEYNPVHF